MLKCLNNEHLFDSSKILHNASLQLIIYIIWFREFLICLITFKDFIKEYNVFLLKKCITSVIKDSKNQVKHMPLKINCFNYSAMIIKKCESLLSRGYIYTSLKSPRQFFNLSEIFMKSSYFCLSLKKHTLKRLILLKLSTSYILGFNLFVSTVTGIIM